MDVGCRLYFKDKTYSLSQSSFEKETQGTVTVYRKNLDNCQVVWKFETLEKGISVDLSVESDGPLELYRIDSLVFSIGKPSKTDRIAFFGNDKSHTEPRFPDELGIGREYCADCVGHFADFTAPGTVLAGVVPFTNVFGAGAITGEDGRVEFFAKTEFTEGTAVECCLKAQQVFFHEAVTVDELYDIYRALLPQSSFAMPKLIGWNTWDYYLDKVTPEDIAENVEALKKMPFASLMKYIVIDDGWQKNWGEWTENEKFSCGLLKVANNIIEAGFIPGIWMAPLCVKEDSTLFQEHPEWLCRKEDGSLFHDYSMCFLDPTNPGAEEFILNNYRYQYEAGYRLFKIDYLSSLTLVRTFYDKSATAYSALRHLMKRIIECTGEDVVILGCSLPVQCGADIAPSMRIAVDIHNHFSHVKWIAEALSWTWMYNNKVTRIDPDFLVVRGKDTSLEPIIENENPGSQISVPKAEQTDAMLFKSRWRAGKQFNASEAETWANLVAICGGNIFLSDRMSMLNDRGIEMIDKAIRAAANQGRPRFLKSDLRLPSVWESDKTILVINWEDTPCEKVVDDRIKVTLAPHESFLISK